MPINYALFENHITPEPEIYAAHVEITGSADMHAIAERIIEQGSTVTSADILAVLEDTIKACEALLLEGYNVNLGGLVRLQPTIKGKFNGLNDKFDPARHQVDVGATPGARVRKTIRENAKVHKDEAIKPTPTLIEFKDTTTGAVNDTIRIGGLASITGYRLKYDKAQPDEGIYFIPTGGAPEFKVTIIQTNLPAQLIFASPADLTPSTNYHLEIRARIDGGTELRTGRLDATLRTL